MDTFHVSSLIIHARPERMNEVSAIITERGGEIAASDPCGKMVVVIETDTETAITDFANDLAVMPGVLGANLVFHHVEDPDPAPPDGASARS